MWTPASNARGAKKSVDVDQDKLRAGDVRLVLEQLRAHATAWLTDHADASAVLVEAPVYAKVADGEDIRGKLQYFLVRPGTTQ